MLAIFIRTSDGTPVTDLIIGGLTIGKRFILLVGNLGRDAVVIGTVIGDVQLTVAVHEGQVTLAIDATGMAGTNGNEVTVIHIVNGGCGIAIHRGGVGIDGGRV